MEAARSILESSPSPLVAYLPAASLERHFIRETKAAFRGLAQVRAIKPEAHPLPRVRAILERASLLYIPGGNTYLLAHRLHSLGLLQELRQRVLEGLPLLGISAGTVFCGQDILTTNDINCCGCTQFAGLGLLPYDLNVHYPPEGPEREARNERLGEYLVFHQTPILALEDEAYIEVKDGEIALVRGGVWKLEADPLSKWHASCTRFNP